MNKGNNYIYLEQYDWNGNPVKKYKLDHWEFTYLDKKNNVILQISTNDDNPFFRYKLPE